MWPRFAILIPAHNEEATLGRLLASLRALDYPVDRWRALVVADNCDDATAGIARAAGVEVYERRHATLRAKGYALAWLLDQLDLASAQEDAYVVVDADSVVSPVFLRALAVALEHGARVAQARYRVYGAERADAASLRAIAFALFNHVRPLGRRALGWSAGLKGNGMCFRREVLRQAGWDAFALAEDVEFHATLLCAGERVTYVPDAIVEGEMPTTLRQARTQQARWERGRIEMIRRQVPRLGGQFVRTGNVACLDAAIEIALPPLALIVALLLVCVLGAAITRWTPVEILAGGLCLGIAVHVLVGGWLARLPARVWLALVTAPVYIAWKCWVYVAALGARGGETWVRTAREPRAPSSTETREGHGH